MDKILRHGHVLSNHKFRVFAYVFIFVFPQQYPFDWAWVLSAMDQTELKQLMVAEFPDLYIEQLNSPQTLAIGWVSSFAGVYKYLIAIGFAVTISLYIFIFVGTTVVTFHCLNQQKGHMSEKTRNMHRMFITSLLLQVSGRKTAFYSF
jgi:hypothetical protein